MGNDTKQFYNPDDGCVYYYDERLNRYRKVCDIPSYSDLPACIKEQIWDAKAAADRIRALPTD
jgi:hypothetical protein